jgi:hypothetical protein
LLTCMYVCRDLDLHQGGRRVPGHTQSKLTWGTSLMGGWAAPLADSSTTWAAPVCHSRLAEPPLRCHSLPFLELAAATVDVQKKCFRSRSRVSIFISSFPPSSYPPCASKHACAAPESLIVSFSFSFRVLLRPILFLSREP